MQKDTKTLESGLTESVVLPFSRNITATLVVGEQKAITIAFSSDHDMESKTPTQERKSFVHNNHLGVVG